MFIISIQKYTHVVSIQGQGAAAERDPSQMMNEKYNDKYVPI